MESNTKYRKCPKCGLNYIIGYQTMCAVCIAATKPYRGKYCKQCGEKSGMYTLCRSCYKANMLSANEQRTLNKYHSDSGMVGTSIRRTCQICGVPTYGKLCGKCYMATLDIDDSEKEDD